MSTSTHLLIPAPIRSKILTSNSVGFCSLPDGTGSPPGSGTAFVGIFVESSSTDCSSWGHVEQIGISKLENYCQFQIASHVNNDRND